MYSYKVFPSQLVKVFFVLVLEIATGTPFPSTQTFKDFFPPALFLLVMFRTLDNLIGPGSGLLNQQVRHVYLLLPPLVYYLSYLTEIKTLGIKSGNINDIQNMLNYNA